MLLQAEVMELCAQGIVPQAEAMGFWVETMVCWLEAKGPQGDRAPNLSHGLQTEMQWGPRLKKHCSYLRCLPLNFDHGVPGQRDRITG